MIQRVVPLAASIPRLRWCGCIKQLRNYTGKRLVVRDQLKNDLEAHLSRIPPTVDHSQYQDIFSLGPLDGYWSRNWPLFKTDHAHVDPEPTLTEYLALCSNKEPVIGSLVEAIDRTTNTAQFGIIIGPTSTLFNEKFNKLTLFRVLDGTTVQISPQDITFHLYSVLSPEQVHSLQNSPKSEDNDIEGYYTIEGVLNLFLRNSRALLDKENIKHSLEMAYLRLSNELHAVPVSLEEIAASLTLDPAEIQFFENSRISRCMVLMATHLHLLQTPNKWLVLSNVVAHRLTNVSRREGFSNSIPTPTVYVAQPHINRRAIDQIEGLSEDGLAHLQLVFDSFKRQQEHETEHKTTDELLIWFSIWADPTLNHFITVMKLYVAYPHNKIQNKLARILGTKVSPRLVHRILQELQIYDTSRPSDIILSANLLGTPHLKQIAVCSLGDLEGLEIQKSRPPTKDLFKHLRVIRPSTTLYAISDILAVSMVTEGKYRQIGIHFPDPGTRIGPSSSTTDLVKASGIYKSWVHGVSGTKYGLFSDGYLNGFGFQTRMPEAVSASELASGRSVTPEGDALTCMSIWFDYNQYSKDPFEELGSSISISVDDISYVQIKKSPEEIEEVLLGTRKSSGFSFFRKKATSDGTLNDTDIHTLKFIQNVFKTYDKIRNIHEALLILLDAFAPEESSGIMFKEDSIDVRENKNVTTAAFKDTLSAFAEDVTLIYCIDRGIQTIKRVQTKLPREKPEHTMSAFADLDTVQDEVMIKHGNLFLPEFLASSYGQTTMAKDNNGYLPTTAKISGNNFLARPQLQLSLDEPLLESVTKGFTFGGVDIINGISSLEALLNQHQILSYLHLVRSDGLWTDYLSEVRKYGYLEQLGYNSSALWEKDYELRDYSLALGVFDQYYDAMEAIHKREWVLRMIHQKGLESRLPLTVVLTDLGHRFLERQMARGFCNELGIEIEVLLAPNTNDTVGSLIEHCELLFVDVAGGRCVVMERDS